MNNFKSLNTYNFWQAFGAAAGSNMTSPSRTILERRDRAEAHNWAVEDMHTMNRWQEHMSSTAHQREVEDLRAAGLNPILSGNGGSGASTPSSAGSAPAEDIDYKDIDASSALDAKMKSQQVQLIKAQEHATNSAADVSKATAGKIRKETDILGPKSTIMKKLEEGASWGVKKFNELKKDYDDSLPYMHPKD